MSICQVREVQAFYTIEGILNSSIPYVPLPWHVLPAVNVYGVAVIFFQPHKYQ